MALTPQQEEDLLALLAEYQAEPIKTISDLESDEDLNGDEVLPIEDSSGTFSTTIAKIKDFTIEKSDDQNLLVKTGSLVIWTKNTPPSGYLECNGAEISRTTYSALFSIIGTTFGTGDGSTTFNIPDLRGYFVRGWSNGSSADSGRSFGSTQTDALQNITGSIGGLSNNSQAASGAFSYGSSYSGNGQQAQTNWKLNFDASSVVRTASETRPRNVALMYCIKY